MNIKQIQKIHVENDIPLPAKKSIRVTRRKWHSDLEGMHINDSFVISKDARPSVYQAAKQLKMKVESREIDTYHVRIFVVGKNDENLNNPQEIPSKIPDNFPKAKRHLPNEAIVI